MRADQYFSEIRTALVDQLGIPEERVMPSARLTEDLEMDSLDRVEFLAVLEGRLGRSIDSEVIENVRTVQDVVGVVEALDPASGDRGWPDEPSNSAATS